MNSQTNNNAWSFVLDEQARILFADDDPILAEFAKVHLSSPVATIEIARDGLEAWRRLTKEPFDLALIDIGMPGIDGFTLMEKIRATPTLLDLPVIMVTGREDIASIDRAYKLGATAFVTKPVNWRQLSHQIRYVLRDSRNKVSGVRKTELRRRESHGLYKEFEALLRLIQETNRSIASHPSVSQLEPDLHGLIGTTVQNVQILEGLVTAILELNSQEMMTGVADPNPCSGAAA